MLSNHKIQVALEEIKEISRTDLALYDDKGKQIAATFEPEPEDLYGNRKFYGFHGREPDAFGMSLF